jgi:hypothetical protein
MRRIISMLGIVILVFSVKIFATSQSANLNRSSGSFFSIEDVDQTSLDITRDISIEVWVKLAQLPSTIGDNVALVTKDHPSTPVARSYCFVFNSQNELNFYYFSNNSTYSQQVSNAAVVSVGDVGTWVHFAVTADVSEKKVIFYRNGSVVPSYMYMANATAIQNSSAPFHVGREEVTGNTWNFDGQIDEVRVWGIVRAAQDIFANYSHELNSLEGGLVGFWRLNGNAYDETVNHNDFVGQNTPTYVSEAAPIIHKSISFSPILGILSNGLPEIAVLKINDSSLSPEVKILDASNSQVLSRILFFNYLWKPIKVDVFDINNDSIPEVSVMASRDDSTATESRSISNGNLIRIITLP